MEGALWSFTQKVDYARALRLLRVPTFDVIVTEVSAVTPSAFRWSKGASGPLSGCRRVEFLILVQKDTYDAFFNAPVGYRGQYAISVESGDRANRHLLCAAEDLLVGYYLASGFGCDVDAVEASLRGAGAKIWIDETEVEPQMGRSEAEIVYEPWRKASENGAGLLAPVGQRLEIKGAWIDANNQVHMDPRKSTRSEEIHTVGFT